MDDGEMMADGSEADFEVLVFFFCSTKFENFFTKFSSEKTKKTKTKKKRDTLLLT